MSQLRAKLAPFVANYSEAKFNKVLLGAFSCSLGYYQTQRTRVHAKTPLPAPTVVVKPREVEGFSWSRLWGFLKRYVLYLGFGIAMAMTSAYFNIQVPLCLGSITNVLTEVIKRDASISMRQYWELMLGCPHETGWFARMDKSSSNNISLTPVDNLSSASSGLQVCRLYCGTSSHNSFDNQFNCKSWWKFGSRFTNRAFCSNAGTGFDFFRNA